MAGEGLVDRDVVGVAVCDLPLTVLATEDVSDAQGVRLDRDTNHRMCDVFEADHVRQVPTDVSGQEIEAVLSGPGPPRGEPAKDLADLVPSTSDRHFCTEHRSPGR